MSFSFGIDAFRMPYGYGQQWPAGAQSYGLPRMPGQQWPSGAQGYGMPGMPGQQWPAGPQDYGMPGMPFPQSPQPQWGWPMPIPQPQEFYPIATDFIRYSMFGFDSNQDGGIDATEAQTAATRMDSSGSWQGKNLGKFFDKLANALQEGNPQVDRDGDGKLSYEPTGNIGFPWPFPNPQDELTRLAGNDRNPYVISQQDFAASFPLPWPMFPGIGAPTQPQYPIMASPPPMPPGIDLLIPPPPPNPVLPSMPPAQAPADEKILQELTGILGSLIADTNTSPEALVQQLNQLTDSSGS